MDTTNRGKEEEGGEGGRGGEDNPFARSGKLRRSPQRQPSASAMDEGGEATASKDAKKPKGKGAAQPADEAMDGVTLLREVKKRKSQRPVLVAAVEQLDKIVEYVCGRPNQSKDLKESLLLLQQSMQSISKESAELQRRLELAERGSEKADRSVQTEPFVFVRNQTMAEEALAFAGTRTRAPAETSHPGGNSDAASGSHGMEAEGTWTEVNRNKRRRVESGSGETGENGGRSEKEKEGGRKHSRKKRKKQQQQPQQQPQLPQQQQQQQQQQRQQQQQQQQQQQRRQRKPKPMRSKGDALIVKTSDPAKYADVLKSMRGDPRLSGLGEDVRSIRRTRTGEMILQLKRTAARKGAEYKVLAKQALGDEVQVRTVTDEVTIQCKNLDEISEAGDVVHAFREQCAVELATTAIRLKKGASGTQVAIVRLPADDANLALKVAKIKVGWSVCPLSILQLPETCFRCWEYGHKSWACKGPDRSNLCRRCGGDGHKARDCSAPAKCAICSSKGTNDGHVAGGWRCTASKPGTTVQARS